MTRVRLVTVYLNGRVGYGKTLTRRSAASGRAGLARYAEAFAERGRSACASVGIAQRSDARMSTASTR